MKRHLIIVLISLFGCIQLNSNKPDNALSREEMAKVMTEVHILEAKIYKLYLKQDTAKKLYKHYENMLFDSLGITNEQFESSLAYYYSSDVKEFQKAYEIVVDSLLARQKTSKD